MYFNVNIKLLYLDLFLQLISIEIYNIKITKKIIHALITLINETIRSDNWKNNLLFLYRSIVDRSFYIAVSIGKYIKLTNEIAIVITFKDILANFKFLIWSISSLQFNVIKSICS